MFKSIFVKYFSLFMIIIIISYVILAGVVMTLANGYEEEQAYFDFQNIARTLSVYVGKDYRNHFADVFENGENHPPVIDTNLTDVVSLASREIPGCVIFIANKDGYICSLGSDSTITLNKDDEVFFFDVSGIIQVPKEYMAKVLSDKVVSGHDTLDGILQKDSYYSIVPIISSGIHVGAVFAGSNAYEPDHIQETIGSVLLVSSICVLIATLVAVYITSYRLTRPLKDMKHAVTEFSRGNFDVKVKVRGKDEVANLSIAFNTMAKSLANLEDMRSSFVSSVSHELRTPMTTIGGFVDSILNGAIPQENEKHYLEIISGEIKRLSRLITSLLEISKLETGQAKLNLSTFDICEMARVILISNEQRLTEKNLDVEFECDDYNTEVVADRDLIHQVMFNLMDNAIKFSKEGGKYIIGIRKQSPKICEITVYNEGMGIKKENLPFVFDRFYKSDKSRSLDRSGVGLGLFIAKSIINNHNQDIKAESEEGKWSRFTFTLPLK